MSLEPPVKPLRQRLIDLGLLLAVVVALAFSAPAVHLGDMGMLFSHSSNMQHFLAGMRHPDFDHWRDYAQDMFLTLQMALWGSFLAVLLAVPLGLLAARNVAPVYIQQPVRRLLDALRSVPDLVVGTLFVLAVGLGPLAGVLAIALNTGGVLGKLFSEAVESIDPAPVEGVRAVGAHPLAEVVYGVAPQVAPLWTSFALYRFESNARSATILGLIGAGGIGQRLFESLEGFEYGQTAMIILVIVASVSMIDLLSQAIRTRLT
jgi:phosphonate transport system permease protein